MLNLGIESLQNGWDLGGKCGRSYTLFCEYTVKSGMCSGNRAFHFSVGWETSFCLWNKASKKIQKKELMPSLHEIQPEPKL